MKFSQLAPLLKCLFIKIMKSCGFATLNGASKASSAYSENHEGVIIIFEMPVVTNLREYEAM